MLHVRVSRCFASSTKSFEQLRPVGPLPGRASIPRRDWHAYLILYNAYVEGQNNYRIMNWLPISEGTFNRTRRSALNAVARVMQELEEQHGVRRRQERVRPRFL